MDAGMAPAPGVRPEFGKKVFFLYPLSVMGDDLLREVQKEEYQVYILKDHAKVPKLMAAFPGSIIFINIDAGMEEPEWEGFIRGLMTDTATAGTGIGVLTYNKDPALSEKYLMEIGIPCGFVHLKQGLREATKIIVKILEANEARGRRRFVRARCSPGVARLNVKYAGKLLQGEILDISSAGMTFRFENGAVLPGDTVLDDIQLRLRGVPCRARGKVMGTTRDDASQKLLMFAQPLPEESLDKIRMYVSIVLQEEMEGILAKL